MVRKVYQYSRPLISFMLEAAERGMRSRIPLWSRDCLSMLCWRVQHAFPASAHIAALSIWATLPSGLANEGKSTSRFMPSRSNDFTEIKPRMDLGNPEIDRTWKVYFDKKGLEDKERNEEGYCEREEYGEWAERQEAFVTSGGRRWAKSRLQEWCHLSLGTAKDSITCITC